MLGFLGTGAMVEVLKHRGAWHRSSDLLNRAVNTGASWSARDLRVAGDTLSGSDAFLGFWLRKRLLTSLSCMTNGGPGGPAQRQTTGEDWVVVGRGDQEEAADDEQQQKVRFGCWRRHLMTRGRSGGSGGGGLKLSLIHI